MSGPLSDKSMVPDAATLTQVIESGLLQSASQFAKRLAPVRHLAHGNGYDEYFCTRSIEVTYFFADHVWPPEF